MRPYIVVLVVSSEYLYRLEQSCAKSWEMLGLIMEKEQVCHMLFDHKPYGGFVFAYLNSTDD